MPLPLKPILTLSLLILFFGSLSQAQVPTYVRPSDHPIPDTLSYREFNLKDGTHFYGRIVGETATDYDIKTNAGLFKIRKTGIRSINTFNAISGQMGANILASKWGRDKNAYKSIIGQTAYNMAKGDINLNQSALAFTTINYGLSDNFQIGFGTSLFFISTPPLLISPKASIELAPKFRLGVGAQIFGVPLIQNASWTYKFGSLVYSVATIGTQDLYISGGLGYGYVNGSFSSASLATISGACRVSKAVSFMGETFFIPQYDRIFLGIFGLRYRNPGGHSRWDFAIGTLSYTDVKSGGFIIPVPLISYSYNF